MSNKSKKTPTTKTKQNGLDGTKAKLPAEMELRAAFRYVYDTLEGLVLVNHYTLLGDAARAVKMDDYTPFEKVEVGIQTNRLTPEVISALESAVWGYHKTDKGWEQTKFNVPIIFREIKRKYQFFQNPDRHYFDVDEYLIPNPFNTYWKARFIVQ